MITNLPGKNIYGSILKSQMPENINNYDVILKSQIYSKQIPNRSEPKKTHVNYIEFLPKASAKDESLKPFKIKLTSCKIPSNLLCILKKNKQTEKYQLDQKINRRVIMEMEREQIEKNLEEIINLNARERPMEIVLESNDERYSDSKQQNAAQQFQFELKEFLIRLLKTEDISTIKQMKTRAEKQLKRKVFDRHVKSILDEILDNNPENKRSGRVYTLRMQYLGNDEFGEIQGRKRIKN